MFSAAIAAASAWKPPCPNRLQHRGGSFNRSAPHCSRVQPTHSVALTQAARHVYIDLGANWGTTARTWADIGCSPWAKWEAFLFEAAPVMWRFLGELVDWLNREREAKPTARVPTAGSSDDVARYFAHRFGCPGLRATERAPAIGPMWETLNAARSEMARLGNAAGARQAQMRVVELKKQLQSAVAAKQARKNASLASWKCVSSIPEVISEQERLLRDYDRDANSSELRRNRLGQANAAVARHGRYTLVPAAAGASDGWLDIPVAGKGSVSVRECGRAGCGTAHKGNGTQMRVPVVDVVNWLKASFSEPDWVVLKMDIEGAEHPVLERLFATGAHRLIDVLAWECHEPHRGITSQAPCARMKRRIRSARPPIVLLKEGEDYDGFDTCSKLELGLDAS
jgi:FkbM family methyltransferase